MENNPTKFYKKAKEIWSSVVKVDSARPLELELDLEIHKRLLSLFQPGSYYYFIFNIFQGDLDFVSPAVTNILGYEPKELSIPFIIERVHPDDKSYFLNFEHYITQFFKSVPYEKIEKYKVQYDFRIKGKNNRYVRILHQAVQIDYDRENFYRTLGIDTDISHIKQEGLPTFSIIGLDGEPSYYNIQTAIPLTQSYDLFTKREREILKLIVESKSSKRIAESLSVSLHTVNAHRKNILLKAEVKTPLDLVKKAINEGWV